MKLITTEISKDLLQHISTMRPLRESPTLDLDFDSNGRAYGVISISDWVNIYKYPNFPGWNFSRYKRRYDKASHLNEEDSKNVDIKAFVNEEGAVLCLADGMSRRSATVNSRMSFLSDEMSITYYKVSSFDDMNRLFGSFDNAAAADTSIDQEAYASALGQLCTFDNSEYEGYLAKTTNILRDELGYGNGSVLTIMDRREFLIQNPLFCNWAIDTFDKKTVAMFSMFKKRDLKGYIFKTGVISSLHRDSWEYILHDLSLLGELAVIMADPIEVYKDHFESTPRNLKTAITALLEVFYGNIFSEMNS